MGKQLNLLSWGFLGSGLVILLLAVSARTSGQQPSPVVSGSIKERDIAIQQALENGQDTYQYTTNFIPGIGVPGSTSGND